MQLCCACRYRQNSLAYISMWQSIHPTTPNQHFTTICSGRRRNNLCICELCRVGYFDGLNVPLYFNVGYMFQSIWLCDSAGLATIKTQFTLHLTIKYFSKNVCWHAAFVQVYKLILFKSASTKNERIRTGFCSECVQQILPIWVGSHKWA